MSMTRPAISFTVWQRIAPPDTSRHAICGAGSGGELGAHGGAQRRKHGAASGCPRRSAGIPKVRRSGSYLLFLVRAALMIRSSTALASVIIGRCPDLTLVICAPACSAIDRCRSTGTMWSSVPSR